MLGSRRDQGLGRQAVDDRGPQRAAVAGSSEPSPVRTSKRRGEPRMAERTMWLIGCQWYEGMIRSRNSEAIQTAITRAITGSWAHSLSGWAKW